MENREKKIPDGVKLGSYILTEKLGAGGMGVVYKAYHPGLDKYFAIKTIAAEKSTPENIKRFLREAKVAANLKHPNIVEIHDVAEESGKYYIVMEYITGKDMACKITEKELSLHHTLEIIKKIALALDFSHSQGIVHRDIKPSNIIINSKQNPYLMDFGLATSIKEKNALTKSGEVLGTPQYMSPEQIEGKTRKLDARSDIYSLGAVLYEALSGKPVFHGNTALQVLYQRVHTDIIPLSKRRKNISRDIEAIVMKCLEQDPEKRYARAKELANDIDLYLRGENVLARLPGFLEKIMRKKKICFSIFTLLCILFSFFYFIFFSPGSLIITAKAKIHGELKIVTPIVKINGENFAIQSGIKYNFSRGYYKLEMSLKDYKTIERLVEIAPGKEIQIEPIFEREQSKISIAATLSGIRTTLINKTTHEKSNVLSPIYEHLLDIGEYDVLFEKQNYFPQKMQATIEVQKTAEINLILEPMLLERYRTHNLSNLVQAELVDVNLDGKLDIVCVFENGSLASYNFFSHEKIWQVNNTFPSDPATQLIVNDINKDGFFDFIIGNRNHFISICGRTLRTLFSIPSYFGSKCILYDANQDGYDDYIVTRYPGIECYSSKNNQPLWKKNIANTGACLEWIDQTHLLFNYQIHDSSNVLIYCLAILNLHNGNIQDFLSYKTPIQSIKIVTSGNKKLIIVYGFEMGLLCIDASTRRVVWELGYLKSAPAYMKYDILKVYEEQDKILLQLDKLYCLDLQTGKERWKSSLDDSEYSSLFFLGKLQEKSSEKILVASNIPALHVIEANTGKEITKFCSELPVISAFLYDIEKDGNEEVFLLTEKEILSIATHPSVLKVFDQLPLLGRGPEPITAIDIYGNGYKEIFCINKIGKLFSFNMQNYKIKEYRFPFVSNIKEWKEKNRKQPLVIAGDKNRVFAFDPLNEKIVWEYNLPDEESEYIVHSITDMNNDGKQEIFIVSRNGGAFYCLDLNTGKILWRIKLGRTFVTPIVADLDQDNIKEILILPLAYISNNRFPIYCINGITGQNKWVSDVIFFNESSHVVGTYDINHDGIQEIFVCQIGGYISCIHGKNGNLIWEKFFPGGSILSPPLIGDWDKDRKIEVICNNIDNINFCLDAHNGNIHWTQPLSPKPRIAKEINLDRLFFEIIPLGEDIDQDSYMDYMVINFPYFSVISTREGNRILDIANISSFSGFFLFEDINNNGIKDFVFLDTLGKLKCIYDFNQYINKIYQSLSFAKQKYSLSQETARWRELFLKKNFLYMEKELKELKKNNIPSWYISSFYEATLMLYQGKIQQALEISKNIQKNTPAFSENLFLQAILYLKQSQIKHAKELFLKLLSEYPLEFDSFFYYFQDYFNHQDRKNFQKLLLELTQENSFHQIIEQATKYIQLSGKSEEAALYLELSLRYCPPESNHYKECKKLYITQIEEMLQQVKNAYQYHEVFNILNHAINLIPNHTEFFNTRGKLYLNLNNQECFQKGIQDLEYSLSLDPKQPEIVKILEQIGRKK